MQSNTWRRSNSDSISTSGSPAQGSPLTDGSLALNFNSYRGGAFAPKIDGTYMYGSHTLVKRTGGKPFVLGELLFKEDGTVFSVYNYKSAVRDESAETALSPIGVANTLKWKMLGANGIVGESFSGTFSSDGHNLHLHLYDERSGAKLNTIPYFYHYIPCAIVPPGTKSAEEGIILSDEEFEWNNKLSLRFIADDADHNLDADNWEEYLRKPGTKDLKGSNDDLPSPRVIEEREPKTGPAGFLGKTLGKQGSKDNLKKGKKTKKESKSGSAPSSKRESAAVTSSPTPSRNRKDSIRTRGTAISGTFILSPRKRGTRPPKTKTETAVESGQPKMTTTLFHINRDLSDKQITEKAEESGDLMRPIKGSYLLIKRGGDKTSSNIGGHWVINLTPKGEESGAEFAKFWPTNMERYGGDPAANLRTARGIVFDSRILFMDKKGRTCVFNIDPLAIFS